LTEEIGHVEEDFIKSERKVVVLLFFFCASSSRSRAGTYAPHGLRIIKQIQNIVHEVVLVRVLLVVEASLESLLEDGYDVCAIGRRHKLKWALNFLEKLVASIDG